MPSPQRFSGESIIIWSDLDITISVPWYIGLMFRTRKVNGMLMQANAGAASKINIQVKVWLPLVRKELILPHQWIWPDGLHSFIHPTKCMSIKAYHYFSLLQRSKNE